MENEILWNNHEVTIGGKSVFWYDTGVATLPDILDKKGKFLTFTAFKEKYKINTDFLCCIYWLVWKNTKALEGNL